MRLLDLWEVDFGQPIAGLSAVGAKAVSFMVRTIAVGVPWNRQTLRALAAEQVEGQCRVGQDGHGVPRIQCAW
jgi:hypothetical protein